MLSIFADIRLRFHSLWPIILAILGCVYFGYHSLSGDRGLLRLIEVEAQLQESNKIALAIAKYKENWQKQVKSLSSSALDLDKLEEVALDKLNFGSSSDFVVTDADFGQEAE